LAALAPDTIAGRLQANQSRVPTGEEAEDEA
jgi:hypothetical protein